MQKAETSLIPDQNPEGKPKLIDLVKISIDESKKIYVNWPLDKKELSLLSLAEAIKLVASYQDNKIVKPAPRFTDFIRGIKR